MSLFEQLKGERKMSLNHWRYRLLHWAFSVTGEVDPKNPPDWSGLPEFLYTHYCPLFHLTNLIAILVPAILFIKFCVVLCRAVGAAWGCIPFGLYWTLVKKWVTPSKDKKPRPAAPPCREKEHRKAVSLIRRYLLCKVDSNPTFEHFWHYNSSAFSLLAISEVSSLYETLAAQIQEARERSQARREKWRQRVVFWTYFSSVFLKWFMNVFYVGLTLLVLWLTVLLAIPTWHAICWLGEWIAWLFTDAVSWAFVVLLLKMAFYFVILVAFFYTTIQLFIRVRFFRTLGYVFYQGAVTISPPFFIMLVPFRWIATGCRNLCEFVAIFYEENCPPIQLVSDEEAAIHEEDV